MKHGFTLIELLVVIAMIALLVTILAPSLQNAKDLARAAICMSNGHGLSVAHTMYAEESEQYFASPVRWPVELLPYLGDASIIKCPSSRVTANRRAPDGGTYARIYCTQTYEDEEAGWHGDYYVDLRYKSGVYGLRSGCTYGWNYRPFRWWWQIGEHARPCVEEMDGELVILGDNNMGPYHGNSYGIMEYFPPGSTGSPTTIHFSERHLGRGTVVRLQGHVQRLGYYDMGPLGWTGEE